jgi:hypothetical protein
LESSEGETKGFDAQRHTGGISDAQKRING